MGTIFLVTYIPFSEFFELHIFKLILSSPFTGAWMSLNLRCYTSCYWANEASPTLGCSIEISRDIYIYIYVVGMLYVVCLSYVKSRGITWNHVNQTRACSKSVLGCKI